MLLGLASRPAAFPLIGGSPEIPRYASRFGVTCAALQVRPLCGGRFFVMLSGSELGFSARSTTIPGWFGTEICSTSFGFLLVFSGRCFGGVLSVVVTEHAVRVEPSATRSISSHLCRFVGAEAAEGDAVASSHEPLDFFLARFVCLVALSCECAPSSDPPIGQFSGALVFADPERQRRRCCREDEDGGSTEPGSCRCRFPSWTDGVEFEFSPRVAPFPERSRLITRRLSVFEGPASVSCRSSLVTSSV